MTQFDFGTIDPSTKNGTELASDLNQLRDRMDTTNRGTDRPDYAQGGMLWVDDSGDPSWSLMMFNGAAEPDDLDVELFVVNKTTGVVSLGSSVSFSIGLSDIPQTGGSNGDVLSIVSGNVAWATITGLSGADGSDGAPTYGFASSAGNGSYLHAANTPAWASNGVKRMQLSSAGVLEVVSGAVTIGVDDATAGLFSIFGDNGTQGGRARLYNSASEDATIEYWQIEANDSLRVGTNSDSGLFSISATVMQFTGGTARVGASDTTAGLLEIYGDNGTQGGRARLYNSASEDATIEYWQFEVSDTILSFGPNTNTTMFGATSDGFFSVASLLLVGVDDATRGQIFLYGDNGTNGAAIRLHNGASEDATIEYWAIEANDSLRIGTNGTAGLFTLSATSVVFTGGTLQLGVSDTTAGLIEAYGNASTSGGIWRLYNGDSEDATYNYWQGHANTHLEVGPSTDTDMFVFNGEGRIEGTAAGFRSLTHAYTAPSTGTGVELYYDSAASSAVLISINRAGPTFAPLGIAGSTITIGGNLAGNGPILLGQSATSGYVSFPRLTTTQKNNLAGMLGGSVVFDTTLGKLCVYSGSAWQTITSV